MSHTSFDACVVGSGPAGLVVAHELAQAGKRVCLLESGQRYFEPQAQALSDGPVAEGLPGLDLLPMRRRQLGGNSLQWCVKLGKDATGWRLGLRYAPFVETDFEVRPWVPMSGWPISHADLQVHFERAYTLAQVEGPVEGLWETQMSVPFGLLGSFDARLFRFGPGAAFYRDLEAELESNEACTVLTDHTVVRLERGADTGKVTRVQVRSLDGSQSTIEARMFALATGGVENARLLLASDIGNGHDMVGRCFMDHPLIHIADIIPNGSASWNSAAMFDLTKVEGALQQGHVTLAREVMQREQILSAGFSLFPRLSTRRTRGIAGMMQLANALKARQWPADGWAALRDSAMGLDAIPHAVAEVRGGRSPLPGFGRGDWSTAPLDGRGYQHFEVMMQLEQAPDPANRVTLGPDLDRFGNRLPEVRVRFGELEARTVDTVVRLLTEAVTRSGSGTVQGRSSGERLRAGGAVSMAHHTGATRMGLSPRDSVVDPDGRVHDTPNLFVTGSSVFPTASYANPTLTIIALAARLGRHMAEQLSVVPEVTTAPSTGG